MWIDILKWIAWAVSIVLASIWIATLIAYIVTQNKKRKETVAGKLVVIEDESGEPPYIFLELSVPPEALRKRNAVTLIVDYTQSQESQNL